MATLADSFLADFESSGEEEEEEEEEEEGEKDEEQLKVEGEQQSKAGEDEEPDFGDGFGDDFADEAADLDAGLELSAAKQSGLTKISSLLGDNRLQSHLALIKRLSGDAKETDNEGEAVKMEEDECKKSKRAETDFEREEEYTAIVNSNEFLQELDNEIATVHKYVRDLYAKKYQELEQLVPNPLDYAKVVKVIQNELDMTLVEGELLGLLPQHTILTISVTATTTIGKPLAAEELKNCLDGCDMIISLEEAKRAIFAFIESRMLMIAPNLAAILGSDVTARMMGVAGGLEQLSKIPACNWQVLGIKKRIQSGFSTKTQNHHMGLLYITPIIQSCPSDLRPRAMRMLSAKCVLASRMDVFKDDVTGESGRKWVEEMVKKIEKWQEPPPPKAQKALAAPLGEFKKKRGGKRARKQKERMGITELSKLKNRMVFGKPEQTDDYTGEGLGMIGVSGTGKLAVKKKNNQNLANRLSRKMQARLNRVKGPGTSTSSVEAAAGSASSVSFTPVQGLEFVQLPDHGKVEEDDNYFSNVAGFKKVGSMAPPPPKRLKK